MLKTIEIENFKGIGEGDQRAVVAIKPITLLFGANSAGKSTVLQAIHYAREILERHNLDPDTTLLGGEAIDLGGFRSLVHMNDLSRSIRMKFTMDFEGIEFPDYGLDDELLAEKGLIYEDWHELEEDYYPLRVDLNREVKSAWIGLTMRWSEMLNRPQLIEYDVGLNGESLATIQASPDGRRVGIGRFNFSNPIFTDARRELAKIMKNGEDDGKPRGEAKSDESDFDAAMAMIHFLQTLMFAKDAGAEEGGAYFPLGGQDSALPVWGKPLGIQGLSKLGRSADDEDRVDPVARMENIRLLTQMLVGPGELLRDLLRDLRYVGPLRRVPRRERLRSKSEVAANWASGIAAWDLMLERGFDFVSEVSEWLSREDHLSTGYSLRLKQYRELDEVLYASKILRGEGLDILDLLQEEIKHLPVQEKIMLVDENRRIEVYPYDIGIGMSQLIPVVVAVLDDGSPIVAIEQPELHIHPRIQVGLGDLFIEESKRGAKIFLIETHSEHLMLRLMRRIRETHDDELPPGAPALTPERVAVHYVEQIDQGVVITPLELDATGEFKRRWPRGFFEERGEELF